MSLLLDGPSLAASPRYRLVPDAVDSEGDLACDLAAGYGLTPFDWQRMSLVDVMGVRPDGRWAAARAGLSLPRQNGKNGDAEILELWDISQLGLRVLHSAHEVKTARKAFKRLLAFFDNRRKYPELADMVKEIRRTNGQEAVELHNGGSVEFMARTRSSGRGYSADVLVLDEAQELTDDELEAMLPTISASANPQTVFMGTPPKPEQPATVWRRIRAAGIEGTDSRLCWIEYSADPDDDPCARETHAKANPGAPVSIGWDAITDEQAALSVEGFARERLGIWQPKAGGPGAAIPDEPWQACRDLAVEMVGRKHLALDVSPSQSDASICVAAFDSSGAISVQVTHTGRGTHWVADRLKAGTADTGSPVTIVKGTAAESLVEHLEREEIPFAIIPSTEYAIACGELLARVTAGTVHHRGQPDLETAVAGATAKAAGERWVFDRRTPGVNITPVCAAAAAVHVVASNPDYELLESIY